MSHEQPPVEEQPTQEGALPQHAAAPAQPAHEPLEQEDAWMEEPQELPRRPRRRLLTPLPLAMLGILLLACGFIGGVLVEKGEGSSSSSGTTTGSLSSRFAALRAGAGGSSRSSSGESGAAALFGGSSGGSAGARPVAGQVAYLAGNTLYVTNTEGNTIKVMTSQATTVTKNVTASVNGIHPGETVTVTGTTDAGGALNAESIRVGSSGGGGLAALFGGGGASSGSGSASSGSGAAPSGSGGAQALFGNGG